VTDIRQESLRQWFSQQIGIDNVTLAIVCADASFRRYYRYQAEHTSYILVDAPVASEKNSEFIEFSKRYSEQGIDVPRVLFYDLEQGFLCVTDLGDQTLLPLLLAGDLSWYAKAIKQLELLANVTHPGQALCYDRDFFNLELALFSDWFCGGLLNLPQASYNTMELKQCFQILVNSAIEQPQVSVHRDFHSRNIMVRDDNSLAVIDFQDTVMGPLTYDLASLLKDCYFKLPLAKRDALLMQAYRQFSAAQRVSDDFNQFRQWFDLMALQRHLKVCGIFSRLSLRDGKHHYLDDLPLVVEYIIETCRNYPQLLPLQSLFEQHVASALSQREPLCMP